MVAQKSRVLLRSQFNESQSCPGSEKFMLEQYHIVDLDQGIIHRNISPPLLICRGIGMSSLVSFGGSVYMFGGCDSTDDLTETESYKRLYPKETFYTGSAKLQIVNHDDGKVSGLWLENPRRVFGPLFPVCTCLNGKIYNFGFVKFCPQVYDPITNCWEDICFPSKFKGCNVYLSPLPDVSANRIIICLKQVEQEEGPSPSPFICAFHPASNDWETIVPSFGCWFKAAAIADDVIYFNYRRCPTLIEAYDLKNHKLLDVHCSLAAIDGWSISALRRYPSEYFFSLGDNTFCLAFHVPVHPKSRSFPYSDSDDKNDDDDDDDDVDDDGSRKCRFLFFKVRIERRDSIVNLVPQSVHSFILPATGYWRSLVLLS